ncbi:MAG TPA: hypothetical protein PLZ73_00560 [bacterium]|nr:hypothetical protein [bacterium]
MRKNLRYPLVLALAAGVFCLPLLLSPGKRSRDADWNQVGAVHSLLVRAIVQEGRLPFWTPFLGGGYPIFAHPENDCLDPFFALSLFLDIWLALKIRILIFYWAAAGGMYLLVRRGFGLDPEAAFLAGVLFAFGTYFPFHFATGNLYIGFYSFLPWLLFLLVRAATSGKARLGAALVLVWLLAGATGLWVGAMGLFLGIWALLGTGSREFPRIGLGRLCGIALAAALLSAFRLLPMAELIARAPRSFSDYREASRGSLDLPGLARSLLDAGPFLQGPAPPEQEAAGLGRDEPLGDSTVYLGPPALFLAAVGLWKNRRRYWQLPVLLAIFALLTMGAGAPLDLYRLLWHAPVFSSMHFPNKYFAVFLQFILALSAGLGLRGLFPKGGRLTPVVLVAVLGWTFAASLPYAEAGFDSEKEAALRETPFTQVLTYWEAVPGSPGEDPGSIPIYRPGTLSREYVSLRRLFLMGGDGPRLVPALVNRYEPDLFDLIRAGYGVINWYGWLYLPESAQPRLFLRLGRIEGKIRPPVFFREPRAFFPNPEYRGEAWSPGGGRLKILDSGGGRIVVDPGTGEEAVVNQNWYPGWISPDAEVYSRNGLLAARRLPGQSGNIRLFFLPRPFLAGAAVALITAAAGAIGMVRRRRATGR